jgi:catalase (peroxidase I)
VVNQQSNERKMNGSSAIHARKNRCRAEQSPILILDVMEPLADGFRNGQRQNFTLSVQVLALKQ